MSNRSSLCQSLRMGELFLGMRSIRRFTYQFQGIPSWTGAWVGVLNNSLVLILLYQWASPSHNMMSRPIPTMKKKPFAIFFLQRTIRQHKFRFPVGLGRPIPVETYLEGDR